MIKQSPLQVQGILVNVIQKDQKDYISLTDMLKAKDGDFYIGGEIYYYLRGNADSKCFGSME